MEEGQIIENRFKVLKQIGKGSFTKVYKVSDKATRKSYALKLYPKQSPQFAIELEAYSIFGSQAGIPEFFSSGVTDSHQYLIIELLRKSVPKLNKSSRLSFNSSIEISLQLLSRLEQIHDFHFIHRDLKPSNLMTRDKTYNKNSLIYLIDFSLCKKFRDAHSRVHYKYREDADFVGNLQFCSANVHKGIEQSRRDDIESWFYIMIYLLKEKLPWDFEVKQDSICALSEKKTKISYSVLCGGLPIQFVEMMGYIRNLRFDEKPNYQYLRESVQRANDGYEMNLSLNLVNREEKNEFLEVKEQKERRSSSEIGLLESVEKEFKTLKSEEKKRNSSSKVERKRRKDKDQTVKCEMPAFKIKSVCFRIEIT